VPTNETTLVSQAAAGTVTENNRGDVSASTIARMMGMATAAEFRVLEGKVDLLSTKTNSITGKLERVSSALSNVATGSDLERIDVQISSLRTALNEAVAKMDASLESAIDKLVQAAAQNVNKQGASDD
jgi:DNA-binding FrmR family transcriptional regulator